MSYDTNLHRTFDYQLSPAPLRIIDWAPIKSVARSVLQSGQGTRAATVVEDESSNLAAVAAAFAQQEKRRREHGGRDPSQPVPPPGPPLATATATGAAAAAASASTTTPDAGAPAGVAGGVVGYPGLAAASPYYTPGMNSGGIASATDGSAGPAEMYVLPMDEVQLQQLRQQSEAWLLTPPPESAGTSGAAPGAAAWVGGSASGLPFRPLLAAPPDSANGSGGAVVAAVPAAVVVTTNPSASGAPAAGNAGAGLRVGAATPVVAAAAVPPSFAAPATRQLVKSVTQYDAAGTMYGFDAVYEKGTFGVLAGLVTGLGYHHVNTRYRHELVPPALAATSPTAASPGVPESGEGPAMSTPRAGASGGAAAQGSSTSSRIMAEQSSAGGPEGGSDSPTTTTAGATAAAGVSSGRLPMMPHYGPTLATQRRGHLQIYNALQLFWYWGARRWTGVLNVRVTPLPSGDAVVPVCEYVTRTAMTESSIVVDDPVVYLHSFVVMFGQRKRTLDELASGRARSTVSAGELGPVTSAAHAAHPLVSAAAAALDPHAEDGASRRARRHGSPPPNVHRDGSRAVSTAATSPPSHMRSLPMSSARHRSPLADNPPAAEQAAAAPGTAPSAGATSPAPGDTAVARLPEWLYWYQRCVLETTDEWLWSRAADEVASDAAQSRAPWWRPRHIKMGAGLSFRYRKPRGVNVYWGWSVRLGRATHFSGHIDVLRRMSCAVSSTFGFLDISVRLRVNLVTLHQTALDAGLCWRPMPQVPEFAVRLARSANGTTLGVEVADVAPTLYGPLIARLSAWRERRRHASTPPAASADGALQGTAAGMHHPEDVGTESAAQPHHLTSDGGGGSAPTVASTPATATVDSADANREDVVGLLPVTWHYLQGAGATVTSAFGSVKGVVGSAVTSAVAAYASYASSPNPAGSPATNTVADGHHAHGSPETDAARRGHADAAGSHSSAGPSSGHGGATPAHHASAPHPPSPAPPPPLATARGAAGVVAAPLPTGPKLSSMAVPAGQASLRYARAAWRSVSDLGWLERMLRTSHVNVSVGVTAAPSPQHREWSFFVIVSEK